MAAAAAVAASVILIALSGFQALLIAGRPLGRFAWGGSHEVLPPALRAASAASLAVYAIVAVVLLDGADIANALPGDWAGAAAWGLAGYFLVGVALNAASRSRDERRVMTPVAVALCLLCLVVALGS